MAKAKEPASNHGPPRTVFPASLAHARLTTRHRAYELTSQKGKLLKTRVVILGIDQKGSKTKSYNTKNISVFVFRLRAPPEQIRHALWLQIIFLHTVQTFADSATSITSFATTQVAVLSYQDNYHCVCTLSYKNHFTLRGTAIKACLSVGGNIRPAAH